MKEAGKYTDQPMDLEPVQDSLPPPGQLALKEPTVKVAISLSRSYVQFFKQQARHRKAPYQAMIRRVLDLYAARYR